MLQQTQVPRVKEKYVAFIRRFPDFSTLSHASLAEVMKEWQGLGYNRRAKYLHELSIHVVEELNGVLPQSPDKLISLPGIGKATAGSIAAFAYNSPVVFIETNIRRVFIHHFFSGDDLVSDAQILPLVELTLDRRDPREWYYALMDYGTWLVGRMPNPNRRSRHYVRQSAFEGSDRQIRGKILRRLISETTCPPDVLVCEAGDDPDRGISILSGMIQEGLLCESEAGIKINDNRREVK
jgi:A/G-specific adenine glycosylase